MARRNRMSVQKRLRERQKAEKAAQKREQRNQRSGGSRDMDELVATQDDLEGYGVIPEDDEEPDASER